MVLAHPNVPGILLSQMEAQRIGSHGNAYADVSVAQEHALEKVGGRQITNHLVTSGELESVQPFWAGTVDARASFRRQYSSRGRGCGGLQESSAIGFHMRQNTPLHGGLQPRTLARA